MHPEMREQQSFGAGLVTSLSEGAAIAAAFSWHANKVYAGAKELGRARQDLKQLGKPGKVATLAQFADKQVSETGSLRTTQGAIMESPVGNIHDQLVKSRTLLSKALHKKGLRKANAKKTNIKEPKAYKTGEEAGRSRDEVLVAQLVGVPP